MFIPDPHPGSRLSDPGSKTATIVGKKFVVLPVFVASNFIRLENYYIFEQVEKKNVSQFTKNFVLFTQKIVANLSNLWVWDPGSEKILF